MRRPSAVVSQLPAALSTSRSANSPPYRIRWSVALAARFNLSKAAVRSALARLRAEGLVLAEPRRGHVVAPVTLRDVSDVYELRLLLE
ncbi:MAG: GntR family transcriptional regulator, partial [Deltaproteobacteria bacterium]|nr:GntR family transcriptional regulator [Deltaproteobacteria bacterium]